MPKKKTQNANVKAKVTIPIQTSYGQHLCEFIPDPAGKGYTVVAKHVPGVVTQGKTLQEAERMAREAIELCIECLADEHMVSSPADRRVRRRTLLTARA